MAKKSNLATVLKADLATNIPLKMLAEMVRSQGRGRDTVLAHITPREAAKLKREGGSGTTNPVTGLPEFEDFGGADFAGVGGADVATYAPEPSFEQRFAPTYGAIDTGEFGQTGTMTVPPPGIPDSALALQAPTTTFGPVSTAAAPAFASVRTQPAEPTISPELALGAPTPQAAALQPPTTTPEKPGFLETALGKIDPLRALIAAGGLGFGLYKIGRAHV